MRRCLRYTFNELMERLTLPKYCVVKFDHGYEFVQVVHRDYGKKKDGK